MNWQPIETYDAMKKKPKLCVFWFKDMPQGKNYTLPAIAVLDRHFGSRVCVHWIELPEPPK